MLFLIVQLSSSVYRLYYQTNYPSGRTKACTFNRIAAKRSVFHCFVNTLGETNDMDTTEYATFHYDTVEVKNGLNSLNSSTKTI